jgi:hypothetical protein
MKLVIVLRKESDLDQAQKEVLMKRIEKLLAYYRIYNFENDGIDFLFEQFNENIKLFLENCSLRHSEYATDLVKVIAKIINDFLKQKVEYAVSFKPVPKISGVFP